MITSTKLQPSLNDTLTSYEKGRMFEQYVHDLFNKDYFKLIVWRKSEMIPPPFYLDGLSNPDFEFNLFGKKNYRFAVECKWRISLNGDWIKWAHEKQIHSYQNFENKYHVPVFIAIGLGGEPSRPNEFFLTPLINIHNSPFVHKSKLIKYKRKPNRKFYFDPRQMILF